jgi:hypothetical protein
MSWRGHDSIAMTSIFSSHLFTLHLLGGATTETHAVKFVLLRRWLACSNVCLYFCFVFKPMISHFILRWMCAATVGFGNGLNRDNEPVLFMRPVNYLTSDTIISCIDASCCRRWQPSSHVPHQCRQPRSRPLRIRDLVTAGRGVAVLGPWGGPWCPRRRRFRLLLPPPG